MITMITRPQKITIHTMKSEFSTGILAAITYFSTKLNLSCLQFLLNLVYNIVKHLKEDLSLGILA